MKWNKNNKKWIKIRDTQLFHKKSRLCTYQTTAAQLKYRREKKENDEIFEGKKNNFLAPNSLWFSYKIKYPIKINKSKQFIQFQIRKTHTHKNVYIYISMYKVATLGVPPIFSLK